MRAVRIEYALYNLQRQLTQGAETVEECFKDGMPDGAELVRAWVDNDKADISLNMVFQHESFAEVERGEIVPELRPVFRFNLPEDERDD